MFLHIYICYIQTRAYSPATLCPNCNAIGEQRSEIYMFLCTVCAQTHKLTNAQTDSYIFIYIDIQGKEVNGDNFSVLYDLCWQY
jgi:hypothetical protein